MFEKNQTVMFYKSYSQKTIETHSIQSPAFFLQHCVVTPQNKFECLSTEVKEVNKINTYITQHALNH